jgi:hypothetical protein
MDAHRQPSLARRGSRRAFGFANAACVAVAAVLLAGCGDQPPDRNAQAGITVTQDGVAYSVQDSRELDPEAPDDRVFLGGPTRPKHLDRPDTTLVGVWLQAQDTASGPRDAVAAPRLVTAFGQAFQPMHLPATDAFAYRARRLAPGGELPGPGTTAAQNPEAGLLLVYRVPTDVYLGDRPFTVQFGAGARAASVQLDV